jgi:hypothetical protein
VEADPGDLAVLLGVGGERLGRHPLAVQVPERVVDLDLVVRRGRGDLLAPAGCRRGDGRLDRVGLPDGLDHRPEHEHPAEGVHRVDPVGGDLGVDLLPRRPGRRQPPAGAAIAIAAAAIAAAAIAIAAVAELGGTAVVAAGLGPGAAEQHQLPDPRGGAVGGVEVAARDGQPRDLGVLVEVALVGGLDGVRGDLALEQVVLHGLEGRGLAGAQLGPQVVLRVEEDLPVGLPGAVVPHPGPPGAQPLLDLFWVDLGVDADGEGGLLQAEEVALEVELGGGDRLADPRGGALVAHVDVDQVPLVQVAR